MTTTSIRATPSIPHLPALLAAAFALTACGGDGAAEMPKAEYDQLKAEAVQYLAGRQDSLQREFGLDSVGTPTWDQRTGRLTFPDSAGGDVVAEIQMIGSLSKTQGTWLWAWANPTVRDPLKTGAESVRGYGQRYGIRRLTAKEWPAKTEEAWEVTAVSARVLNALGAYRTEDEDGATYMVITSISRAAEDGGTPASDTLADVTTVPRPAPEARPRAPRDSIAGAGWRPPQ